MGINPCWVSLSIISQSIRVTSPTRPGSMISGGLLLSSRCTIWSFFAWINPPSLPLRPTALPPCWLIWWTMALFTLPPKTISTTSMVASSVRRIPRTNLGLMPIWSRTRLIWGPPPCTTTGFRPTNFKSAMSRAKSCFSCSSTIACPPYLITMVMP